MMKKNCIKVTRDMENQMVSLYAYGVPKKQIAEMLGVSAGCVTSHMRKQGFCDYKTDKKYLLDRIAALEERVKVLEIEVAYYECFGSM